MHAAGWIDLWSDDIYCLAEEICNKIPFPVCFQKHLTFTSLGFKFRYKYVTKGVYILI